MIKETKDRAAVAPTVPSRSPSTRAATRILLVDFRGGECVSKHPDIMPLLEDGWHIRSAVPRLIEQEGTKLMVVMSRERRATPVL